VNEVLQWAVLLVMAVLMLGLYREVAVTLPSRASPPEGPRVGDHIPTELLAELNRALPGFKELGGVTVAFVTENCIGCQRLLAGILEALPDLDGRIVLVAKQPSVAFNDAIRQVPAPTICDATGALWEACSITATPLVVHVDGSGKVVRKEVTHDVRRVALPPS
jgi:hypothetical protein